MFSRLAVLFLITMLIAGQALLPGQSAWAAKAEHPMASSEDDSEDGEDQDDQGKINVSFPNSFGNAGLPNAIDQVVDPSGAAYGSALAFERSIDPNLYMVGVGDQLMLQFWGVQSESIVMVVSPEGAVFVPNVGNIRVDGLTLAEARALIRSEVAPYFTNIEYDVTLIQPRTFALQVLGHVKAPGI